MVLSAPAAKADGGRSKARGVTIEAEYAVGEYDILILSAEQSDGLETWLLQNNYKIPTGAAKVLESYIKQKMRFFVAKVNLGDEEPHLLFDVALKHLRGASGNLVVVLEEPGLQSVALFGGQNQNVVFADGVFGFDGDAAGFGTATVRFSRRG